MMASVGLKAVFNNPAADLRLRLESVLPLPKGEGRGEGKANGRIPTGSQTATGSFKPLGLANTLLQFGVLPLTSGQKDAKLCSIGIMTSAMPDAGRSFGQQVFNSLFAGVVLALIVLIACLSFSSLIFGGELSFGVADGVGVALVSAVVVGLVVAFRSSYPASVAIPQDRTAPILALLAAQVVAALPAESSPAAKLINVLAVIALTSILAGAALYLLGHFRLGNLTRYIPYPVVGGFLSGSGYLLVTGSLRVMTGQPLTLDSLSQMTEWKMVKLWLPGVALGLTLFLMLRLFKKPRLLPILLLGSMVAFHAVITLNGVSMRQLQDAGWLPMIPAEGNFQPHIWSLGDWKLVNFFALFHTFGLVATVVLTAVISILLNSSALELTVQREIDLNRELRAAGAANLAGGLAGGMLGFQSLSLTRLGFDLGSRTRLAGIVTALLCGAALFAGPTAFAYLPKFALGGLLLYMGLNFLAEWIYDGRSKLSHSDYAVVVLILAVMGLFGYLVGVGLGLLAAVFLFIHNYSRVGVITHVLTGVEVQSNVDRPVAHQRWLQSEGGQLHLLKLQGFVFFGTANTLLNNIRSRVEDRTLPPLKCVILDFRRVSGLDSSAALSLAKAGQLARKTGFNLLLTEVPEEMQRQLRRGAFQADDSEPLKFFPDLDHAVEWWENLVLAAHGVDGMDNQAGLREQMVQSWPNSDSLDFFLARLQRREIAESQHLIRQGEPADELYFIESGEVSTLLESADGQTLRRLRRQGGGTVLGELGMLLNAPRSASVVANRPVTAYCLTASSLQQLKAERPDVAADFFEFLSRYLSERVLTATKSLRVLMD